MNPGDSMAISHELSSEIAAALFAAKVRSPRELDDLKEIVLEIHTSLERLGDEARNGVDVTKDQTRTAGVSLKIY